MRRPVLPGIHRPRMMMNVNAGTSDYKAGN
jgi:hypothetical protein